GRMAGADPPLPKKLLSSVPVIVGPTGIGKSQLAFELARMLDGEIVVADSRQVYVRLDIATNKPSPEQRSEVRYHMIDFVDPAARIAPSRARQAGNCEPARASFGDRSGSWRGFEESCAGHPSDRDPAGGWTAAARAAIAQAASVAGAADRPDRRPPGHRPQARRAQPSPGRAWPRRGNAGGARRGRAPGGTRPDRDRLCRSARSHPR